MFSGIIYKATNMVNGNIYIGRTTHTLEARKCIHRYDALTGRSRKYFHNAIRKYGWDNFQWDILFHALNEKELNEMEKYFIANYRATHHIYNLTDGGEGISGFKHSEATRKKMKENPPRGMLGKHHSQESAKKISIANKGKKKKKMPHSEEWKAKMRGRIPWNKGKTGIYSEETLRKLSQSLNGRTPWNKGIPHTEEHKKHLSENHADFSGANHPFYGKHHTAESIRRSADAHRGKKLSEETKLKMSLAHSGEKHNFWGKHHSEESRKKISEHRRGMASWNKGKTSSDEHRKNLSIAQQNRRERERIAMEKVYA